MKARELIIEWDDWAEIQAGITPRLIAHQIELVCQVARLKGCSALVEQDPKRRTRRIRLIKYTIESK